MASISLYATLSRPGGRHETLSLPCRGSTKAVIAAAAIDHTSATPKRAGGSKRFFVTSPKHTLPGKCWWSPGTPREGCWVRVGMNCGAVGSSRRTWGPAIRDGGAKQQVGAVSLLQRTSRCSLWSARADTLRSSLPFLFLSSPAQKVLELFDKELERVSSLSARVCFGLQTQTATKFSRCFQANSSGQRKVCADVARQEMAMSATLNRSQP